MCLSLSLSLATVVSIGNGFGIQFGAVSRVCAFHIHFISSLVANSFRPVVECFRCESNKRDMNRYVLLRASGRGCVFSDSAVYDNTHEKKKNM